MHFLLIPYILLGATFLVQFNARRDAGARGGLIVTSTMTLGLIFIAMALRPAHGDSWRYYQYFLDMRSMGFMDAMSYRDPDPLYGLLNWTVGQVGAAPWWLFGTALAVYFGVFVTAIRRLVGQQGTAILVMAYAAFPFFVAYGVNGLRQGLGLVFLLMAYVGFREGKRSAWIWLLLAPFWHSGMWLAVSVVVLHQIMCRLISVDKARWSLVVGGLLLSIGLSATGLNEALMSILPSAVTLENRYDVYFMDAAEVGYRAGFRADFILFSLVPLFTGWLLRRKSNAFVYTGNGWWLSLYLSLNAIYHLFAFAPFSDRFAAFSWFLMPLVIYLQVLGTRSRSLMAAFVLVVILVNTAMLQLYTGKFIHLPEWLV